MDELENLSLDDLSGIVADLRAQKASASMPGAELLGNLDTAYAARVPDVGPSMYDYAKSFASGAGTALYNLPGQVYELGKAALPYAEYAIPVYGQYRAGQDLGQAIKLAEAERALKEQGAVEYYTPMAKKATEIGVRGGAQIAGALSGGSLGGLAGITTGPGALLTGIAGAATGATTADLAAQQALEYLGISEPTSSLAKAEQAGATFALGGVGEAIPLGLQAAVKSAPKIEQAALGLQRTARGARASDYSKVNKNAIIETVEGDYATQLKQSLDNLNKKNVLGNSVDPELQYAEHQLAKETVEAQIQDVLKKAERETPRVPAPEFDKTIDYIENNIKANEVDDYLSEVVSYQNALQREGRGSLRYLNTQKKIVGESWKNSPKSDPGFWRQLYSDMKEHIEKYAPEVKDLNKEKRDLIVTEPVIERVKRQSEAGWNMQNVMRQLYTTGGAGLGGGYALGSMIGSPIAGIGLALGLRGLATPGGQQMLGRGLGSISSGLDAIPMTSTGVRQVTTPALAGLNVTQNPESSELNALSLDELQAISDQLKRTSPSAVDTITMTSASQDVESPTIKVGKQDVSIPVGEEYAPPDLVKAVIRVESAGKKDAVSTKGARGLMQLMPGTAKQMGVRNSFDPQQNIEGGSKYLNIQLNEFEDPKLALAAYNWGPANVKKYIRFLRQQGIDPTWENIVANYSTPAETRNYVKKVMSFYA